MKKVKIHLEDLLRSLQENAASLYELELQTGKRTVYSMLNEIRNKIVLVFAVIFARKHSVLSSLVEHLIVKCDSAFPKTHKDCKTSLM